jgi:uncharacterized protein (DUF58 family)
MAFPFGIISKELRVDIPGQLLVYPPLYRINRRLLHELSMMDPVGQRQIERSGGTEEFFGLREYRAGESLRYIDWKHSARKGTLIAREMTQPTPPRLMVLLVLDAAHGQEGDGTEPTTNGHGKRRRGRRRQPHADPAGNGQYAGLGLEQLKERAIALTASLVCDAYQQGYQIGLAVQGPTAPVFNPRHSLTHRARLLAALAQLDATQSGAHPAGLSSEPSVVIAVDGSAAPLGRGNYTLLDARQMEQYVTPVEAQRILRGGGARRRRSGASAAVAAPRRQEAHQAEPATPDDAGQGVGS